MSDLAEYVIFHDGNMKHCAVVPLVKGRLPNKLIAVATFESVADAQRDYPKSAIVQLITERTNPDALPPTVAENMKRLFARARMGLLDDDDTR